MGPVSSREDDDAHPEEAHDVEAMGTHPLLEKYAALSDEALTALPLTELLTDTTALTALWETRRQENALLFYEPAQEKARAMHQSTKREVLISGGNRSSKTDTVRVELAIQAT